MGIDLNRLHQAAEAVGATLLEMPHEFTKSLITALDEKFADGKGFHTNFFWEALDQYGDAYVVGGFDKWHWVGWNWLSEFLRGGSVLVWFEDWLGDDRHRDALVKVEEGTRLVPMVG